MEILHAIILLLGTALPLSGAILTFVSKYIKSCKDKKSLENLTLISTAVSRFMIEAESFNGYSGAEKNGYVVSCLKGFAADNGIIFDEEEVKKTIEEFIKFSKNINPKN